jgi:inorganic pyrophosphatase
VILDARVVGGIHMIDGGDADDKIVAVLVNDNVWGGARDLTDLPGILVERLRHYFATYKLVPGETPRTSIEATYGRDHAEQVVTAALEDYRAAFGG